MERITATSPKEAARDRRRARKVRHGHSAAGGEKRSPGCCFCRLRHATWKALCTHDRRASSGMGRWRSTRTCVSGGRVVTTFKSSCASSLGADADAAMIATLCSGVAETVRRLPRTRTATGRSQCPPPTWQLPANSLLPASAMLCTDCCRPPRAGLASLPLRRRRRVPQPLRCSQGAAGAVTVLYRTDWQQCTLHWADATGAALLQLCSPSAAVHPKDSRSRALVTHSLTAQGSGRAPRSTPAPHLAGAPSPSRCDRCRSRHPHTRAVLGRPRARVCRFIQFGCLRTPSAWRPNPQPLLWPLLPLTRSCEHPRRRHPWSLC